MTNLTDEAQYVEYLMGDSDTDTELVVYRLCQLVTKLAREVDALAASTRPIQSRLDAAVETAATLLERHAEGEGGDPW